MWLHQIFLVPRVRCLQNRSCARRGAIATEHATVLGVVALGAVLTLGVVGQTMSGRFQDVANLMASDDGANSANGMSGRQDNAADLASTESWAGVFSVSLASTLAAAPIVIALMLYRLHRRRQKESERLPVDPAQHAEAQSRFIAKRQYILRALSSDIDALLDSQIEVRHVMTSNVRTALPSTPVRDLARQMNELEFRHMLVCSSEGKLLGIVSDRDVRGAKGKTADQVMTRNPITVASTSMLKPAVTLMLDKHISSLPIVDDGRLVGILTLTDLVMALQCTMQVLAPLAAELRAKLQSPGAALRAAPAIEEIVCSA